MPPAPDPEALRESTLGSLLAEEARLSHEIFTARTGNSIDPLEAETYLQALAVRTAIARALTWGSQADVREAIEAGASWIQIATARGTTLVQAREDFIQWIEGQGALWDSGVSPSGSQFGLNHRQRRTLRALATRPDGAGSNSPDAAASRFPQ